MLLSTALLTYRMIAHKSKILDNIQVSISFSAA